MCPCFKGPGGLKTKANKIGFFQEFMSKTLRPLNVNLLRLFKDLWTLWGVDLKEQMTIKPELKKNSRGHEGLYMSLF